jgi:predicted dithiol-disulfide oxidoreductase (DUF899 family)
MTLAHPRVVSQTEWDAALAAMTEREQAVTAAMHGLAAERKRMPMVRVEGDYSFEGPVGRGPCWPLRRAHGLDRRALVHDLQRAVLGRLRDREWFDHDVFLRDGDDVYRTYFLQHGAMVQLIGSIWSL